MKSGISQPKPPCPMPTWATFPIRPATAIAATTPTSTMAPGRRQLAGLSGRAGPGRARPGRPWPGPDRRRGLIGRAGAGQIGEEPAQLLAGGGPQRPRGAVVELLLGEPSGLEVLAQLADGQIAVGV